MDMYRRNSFKDWWEDMGFIYVIVVVFIALIFLLKDARHLVSTASASKAVSAEVADGSPYYWAR
jgi:hypothetical protein